MGKALVLIGIVSVLMIAYGVAAMYQGYNDYSDNIATVQKVVASNNMTIVQAEINEPSIVIPVNSIDELVQEAQVLNQTVIYQAGTSRYGIFSQENTLYQYMLYYNSAVAAVFLIFGVVCMAAVVTWRLYIVPSYSDNQSRSKQE